MTTQNFSRSLAVVVTLAAANALALPKPTGTTAVHPAGIGQTATVTGKKAQLAVLGGLHSIGAKIAAGDAKLVVKMDKLKADLHNPADMAKVSDDASKVANVLTDVSKIPVPEVTLVAGIGADLAKGIADATAPSKGAPAAAKPAPADAAKATPAAAKPAKEFVTVSKQMALKDGVVVVTKTQVAAADVAKYLQGAPGAEMKTTVATAGQ